MSTVDSSKFAQRQKQEYRRGMRSGLQEEGRLDVRILKVYDGETQALEEIPLFLKVELEKYPGKIFALVQTLGTRQFLVRPFRDSMEHVYMTYGNGPSLEGRRAQILYMGGRPDQGEIILSKDLTAPSLVLPLATETYDIGGIV